MMQFKTFLCFLLFIAVSSCKKNNTTGTTSLNLMKDSVFLLIEKGDDIYAVKNSYNSFRKSLFFYDKALEIAERSNDTFLLAEALFAKGRVYDAWNKQPAATIEYFKQASDLFKTIPKARQRYFYVQHLVAHAYDKIGDSAQVVTVLQKLYNEISMLDITARMQLKFVPEMALISSEVKNFTLANKILTNLTSRSIIENDPETYDYLNHYYLTKSRLSVDKNQSFNSPYLDSLKAVFNSSNNVMDRIYYSENLSKLYAASGRFKEAYNMLSESKKYSDSINNRDDVSSMQNAILKSELLAEKRRIQIEETIQNARSNVIVLLIFMVVVVTILSIYLYRQKRVYALQANKLAVANNMLDEKVQQVEVLNKEMQHRIKNNLHLVFSLLQMQVRKVQHKESAENLKDCNA